MATRTAPCPLCGAAIPMASFYCTHCRRNLPIDSQGRPLFTIGAKTRALLEGGWYCPQCGGVADPRRYTKGSFLMEIFLWLMMIFPGLIYSVWRLTTKYAGCPKCGAPNMIPVTSPIAQRALKGTP